MKAKLRIYPGTLPFELRQLKSGESMREGGGRVTRILSVSGIGDGGIHGIGSTM